jgi:hypothetical protein
LTTVMDTRARSVVNTAVENLLSIDFSSARYPGFSWDLGDVDF